VVQVHHQLADLVCSQAVDILSEATKSEARISPIQTHHHLRPVRTHSIHFFGHAHCTLTQLQKTVPQSAISPFGVMGSASRMGH
jgi:hypothetical protein